MRIIRLVSVIGMSAHVAFGQFATEPTQWLNNIELAAQNVKQAAMYADMLKHTGVLKNLPWNSIDTHIRQLQQALTQGQHIVSTIQGADARFRGRYPGYSPMKMPYASYFSARSGAALDSIEAAIRAASLLRSQMMAESSTIDSLRNAAAGSDGRLKAMQATAALTAEVPQQLLSLRNDIERNNQVFREAEARRIQDEAVRQYAADEFFAAGQIQDTGHAPALVP
jgi:P-type conjugative transfer protein TrbJ